MYDEEQDVHPPVQTDERLQKEKDKDALIAEIQAVLNGDHSVQGEKSLLGIVQKQRTLILDIATQTFINKPNNPKLLDSINTILAQMEKSVRDDRKERLKDRELEDNKANFATFVNALNEVTAGRLVMPTFADINISLDPLGEHQSFFTTDDPDEDITQEELAQGRQILDSKEIEEAFEIDPEAPVLLTDGESVEEFDPEA